MVVNDTRLLIAGLLTFTTGLGIGLAVGRTLAIKKLDAEYDVRLAEETIRIDKFHKMMRKEPPYDDIRTAAKAYSQRLDELEAELENPTTEYDEIVNDLGYSEENVVDEPVVIDLETLEPVSNVFEDEDDEMSKILRISPRDTGDPYIITTQEFFDEHDDYDTHTVTYYEDDRMLVDDRGSIVSDLEGNLGPDHNLAFGLGSGEPHVVYIRNERRTNDYEVLREPGSYTEDVLGVVPDESRKTTARRRMRDSEG